MMLKFKKLIIILLLAAGISGKTQVKKDALYHEMHRPQIHFSPKAHWMNDPNGLVYFGGIYHMFFQYYPDSTVWGPNYWGHATSKDLVHWNELPPALAPDSLGLIASGSAVADYKNTAGFGAKGTVPLVAVFAQIGMKGKKWKQHSQIQSVAYSTDKGYTWTKYAKNPVIANPGIEDFRDPKVTWFEGTKKWIMTVATHDHVTFYSSPNLKNWKKESEFGKEAGAHGGVWECPDLFDLNSNGEKIWVLLVSINPGAPNGGSGTQYFTGRFDGHQFIPFNTTTRWVDFGPDNYAGVTWSNTGDRRIFFGWMSNWQYATVVPTERWRSAMTIPRELRIEKAGNEYLLASSPVAELADLNENEKVIENIFIRNYNLTVETGKYTGPVKLSLTSDSIKSFTLTLSNRLSEKVVIGFDKVTNTYYIDRTNSGKVDFEKRFAGRYTAPRIAHNDKLDLTLFIDNASVELFADRGITNMTEIFFPNKLLSDIQIQSPDNLFIKSIKYNKLKSIWK